MALGKHFILSKVLKSICSGYADKSKDILNCFGRLPMV